MVFAAVFTVCFYSWWRWVYPRFEATRAIRFRQERDSLVSVLRNAGDMFPGTGKVLNDFISTRITHHTQQSSPTVATPLQLAGSAMAQVDAESLQMLASAGEAECGGPVTVTAGSTATSCVDPSAVAECQTAHSKETYQLLLQTAVPPRLTVNEQADFCSRVNSHIHSFVILPGIVVYLLLHAWNYDLTLDRGSLVWYNATNYTKNTDTGSWIANESITARWISAMGDGGLNSDLRPLQILLCVSNGYFLADLVFIVRYKVPQWPVFMTHHIVALTATLTNSFLASCRHGSTFVLSMFLLVELSTLPLNMQTWAEQLWYPKFGRQVSTWFWLLVPCWVLSRLILPPWMMYLLVDRVIIPLPTLGQQMCVAPGAASGVLITLFCQAVWWTMWAPEIVNRYNRYQRLKSE